jgi:tetratricopeptide (TPR) repeat protein
MAKSKILKIVVAVLLIFVTLLFAFVAYARFEFNRSFNKGYALYHAKNYKAAEVEFKRAVFWNPYSGMAHAWLGATIIEQTSMYTPNRMRIESAFRHLDRAIKLGFDTHPIRFYRGLIFFNQGNWQKAKSDFEKALTIKPEGAGNKYGIIHALLAQIYSPRQNEAMSKYMPSFVRAGSPDIAVAVNHARMAMKEYLPQSYGWYLVAQVLEEAGAYEEALDAVRQSVERGFDPASAAYVRASILMSAGRTEEALSNAEQTIAAGPGELLPGKRDRFRLRSVAFAHILRAKIYESRNQTAFAKADYKKALEILDQHRAILSEENRYFDALAAQARNFIQDKLK